MKKFYFLFTLIVGVGLSAQTARINEFHYDNSGADVGEFVEIRITDPQPTNLADYEIYLYNGSNGLFYANASLDGTTSNGTIASTAGTGETFYVWTISGIQNGAPDGIALVGPSGLIEFISYEGDFAATDGPANGTTSTDVGVSQSSATQAGESIARRDDGTWQVDADDSPGAANNLTAQSTSVEFASASTAISEDGGSVTIEVEIANPDMANATTVEVALTGGDATNGTDYDNGSGMSISFPITLTFPANDGAAQTIEISIVDDSDMESNETIELELQNVSGGNAAALGGTTSFTLTINDNDSTGSAADARINEFHYDNEGSDVGEFIEVFIADPQPSDIGNYTVTLYNGNDGNSYNSQTLDNFTVTSGTGGSFYVWETSIQNGGPDGLALDYNNTVIEFLSYEGSFTANDGAAAGQASTDIGVSQLGNSPVGSSVAYDDSDMMWKFTLDDTPGAANIITLSVTDINNLEESTVVAASANELVIQGIDVNAVQIYDVNGRLVGNTTNISALANGVYIVRIADPNGNVVSKKFVK